MGSDPRRRARSTRLIVPTAVLILALVVILGAAAWLRGAGPPLDVGVAPSFAPPSSGSEVIVGAGDIATCGSDWDEATARLLDAIPGTVFTTGDNAYPRGTALDFERCYGPTWGRHLERTRLPSAGNHDWDTRDAAGYLGYFGERAAPEGRTWYATELGAWQVIVLDSECDAVGGCDAGSPQLEWLRETLEAGDRRCTVAIWHSPRFSSGFHGNDPRLDAIWRTLHEAGTELVLNGHDHSYERFAPLTPDGERDDAGGIRQIVVGTGGADLRAFGEPVAHSEARNAEAHGVLRVELSADRYGWSFVPVAGRIWTDAGSGRCH